MFIALLMLPLSSISLHWLRAQLRSRAPSPPSRKHTPGWWRWCLQQCWLLAFVGSDFPWLKAADNNARAKHPGLLIIALSSLVANTLIHTYIYKKFVSVSMEILECYLPLRYMNRVLIYIFPNDCHFWPETVTTGTTMTHSKCQHETT